MRKREYSFQQNSDSEEESKGLEKLSDCSAEVPEEVEDEEMALYRPANYAEAYHDSSQLLKK